MNCPFAFAPSACFEEHRRRLLQVRHPGTPIPCNYCKFARTNAEMAHVPADEPDYDPLNFRHFRVNPSDFIDKEEIRRSETRGRKERTTCPSGHRYAIHGVKDTKGHWRCRVCNAARHRQRYAKQKAEGVE